MSHDIQDRASLEMARRIAAGLPLHPEWIALARSNLQRWSRQNQDAPALLRCYAEWQRWLERPVSEIAAVLEAQTSEGQRLSEAEPDETQQCRIRGNSFRPPNHCDHR